MMGAVTTAPSSPPSSGRVPRAEDEGIEALGTRLREQRVARSIGVRELARMVDCSASLISQIERGRANPSVSTLYAISSALGISLDSLFGDRNSTARVGPRSTRADASARVRRPAAAPVVLHPAQRRVIELERGVQWQLLMPVPERNAEFMEVHYAPGGGSTADRHAIRHNGREYSLVLEGTLSVEIGFERYELEPGDSMAFDSTIPHRIWNAGEVPVRAIWFVIDRWAMSDEAPERDGP
jgi:transcriptional regulator with XRE-family HTH domain